MNALIFLGLITLIIYGILVDATFFKIYIPLVIVYWVVSTVLFGRRDSVGKRRKITIASWADPQDPSSYMPVEYDVTDLVEYINKENKKEGSKAKLTMTYAVTKAMGIGFSLAADNIGRIAMGHFRSMKQIDIALLADVKGGKDLVPVTIKTPHQKSLEDIALIVKEKASRAKSGKDDTHNKNFALADFVPSFILGPIISVGSYLALNLGWDVPIVGAKGDQYPPIIITNIGSFGLEKGFAPLPPMATAICSCMGAVKDKPWVVNGEIEVRKIMTIVHTMDHRAGDAALVVKPFKVIQKLLEDPSLLESVKYDGDKILNPEILDLKKNK
ncbi:unnamed protein product [Moneuplotes crassus]|uniref:2-oxoacid dehydrogenase acyltransferase catalytic domain-containing protein n=2 Tax=Euplotes crassus TaxID=5936 RepID=A0AAD1XNI0_EUPCR|nr:unnamed protein product [Moneuplotes crassus]